MIHQVFIFTMAPLFMELSVVVLGSGQAVPTASRNHAGFFLSVDGDGLLFDCGEGIQRQLRKSGVHPSKVSRIFLTHWHGDHILGLPGLIQTLSLNSYSRTLHIHGPRNTRRFLEDMLRVFVPHQRIDIEVHESSDGVVFSNDNYSVSCLSVKHGVPCLAYSFVLNDKRNILVDKLKKLKISPGPHLRTLKDGKDVVVDGKKLKFKELTFLKPGKRFSLVLDTAYDKSISKFVEGSDLLICESTYSADDAKTAEEYSHLTSVDAARIAKEAKVKKLVLTHFSQRYENREHVLLKQAKKVFKNSFLSEDLDVVRV